MPPLSLWAPARYPCFNTNPRPVQGDRCQQPPENITGSTATPTTPRLGGGTCKGLIPKPRQLASLGAAAPSSMCTVSATSFPDGDNPFGCRVGLDLCAPGWAITVVVFFFSLFLCSGLSLRWLVRNDSCESKSSHVLPI